MHLPLAATWAPMHYPQPLIWIGCLVCFIMVVMAMFRNGASTMGIITLVLSLCCGLGTVVALVVGWSNADRWGIRNLMLVYTIFIILAVVFGAVAPNNPIIVDTRDRFFGSP